MHSKGGKKLIVLERKVPIVLLILDALISRLSAKHEKLPLLRQQVKKYQKGYNGERKLDYYLKSLSSNFVIMNDVTLSSFNKQFQIDSLIITPYAIFVLEVKNFDGSVTFNTNLNQFIRSDGEKLQGYKYPITQVENNTFHLQQWLQERNLDGMPIYYYIGIAEHSTIYNVIGDEQLIKKVVSYVDEIPLRLMKSIQILSEKRVKNIRLKDQIVRAIMKEKEIFKYDVFEKFGIDKREVLPGILCLECRALGMKCIKGKAHCPKCGAISKEAFRRTLYHYVLLIDHEITNKTCREFLQIPSRHTALHKIRTSNLFIKKNRKRWIWKDARG